MLGKRDRFLLVNEGDLLLETRLIDFPILRLVEEVAILGRNQVLVHYNGSVARRVLAAFSSGEGRGVFHILY